MKDFNLGTIKGFLIWVIILPLFMSLTIKLIDYKIEKDNFYEQFNNLRTQFDGSYSIEIPKYEDYQKIEEYMSYEDYQYECDLKNKNKPILNYRYKGLLTGFAREKEKEEKIKNGYYAEIAFFSSATTLRFYENQVIYTHYLLPKCYLKTKRYQMKCSDKCYLVDNYRLPLSYYEKSYIHTLLNDIIKIKYYKKTPYLQFKSKVDEMPSSLFKLNAKPDRNYSERKISYNEFDFNIHINYDSYVMIFDKHLFFYELTWWFCFLSFLPFITFISNIINRKFKIILFTTTTIICAGFYLGNTDIVVFNRIDSTNCSSDECNCKLEHWPIVNYYHIYEQEPTFLENTNQGTIFQLNYAKEFSGIFHKYTYDDFILLYSILLIFSVIIFKLEKQNN
jgi:hypothetical protein